MKAKLEHKTFSSSLLIQNFLQGGINEKYCSQSYEKQLNCWRVETTGDLGGGGGGGQTAWTKLSNICFPFMTCSSYI